MEFLLQFLPIIIYFLLIIIIIVGIVLGIKLIITIDKVNKVVNSVYQKVEQVTPIFNAFGLISTKFSDIIDKIVLTIENFVHKVFIKNKDKDMESEDNE